MIKRSQINHRGPHGSHRQEVNSDLIHEENLSQIGVEGKKELWVGRKRQGGLVLIIEQMRIDNDRASNAGELETPKSFFLMLVSKEFYFLLGNELKFAAAP